jgi:hypothetical protein
MRKNSPEAQAFSKRRNKASKTCTCKEGMEEHNRESVRSAKKRKMIN